MASKRRAASASSAQPAAKRPRSVMTLGEKIKMLEELDSGLSASEVGRRHHVNESTIRGIRQAADKIRGSVRASTDISSKVACVSRRDPIVEKMESSLSEWIEHQNRKKSDVGYGAIRVKALQLYDTIAKRDAAIRQQKDASRPSTSTAPERTTAAPSVPPFQASKGWFQKFTKRQHLHGVRRHGESGSADHEAAAKFKPEFAQFITDEGYRPEQIFNADETALYYKNVGRRTYVSRAIKKLAGYKLSKERVTLLFGGNATGDFRCKPLLIHRSENPRALKGKNKAQLPVIWRSNRKAWMTGQIFEDWFNNCFVNEVEKYLERKNLHFKALLLLDNAPGHSSRNIKLDHPNVKIMFLPPNTTSLLQPMDRGVIKSFKAHYTRVVYEHGIRVIDTSDTLTMLDFLKSYSIRDGIQLIKDAWDSVKETTLNSCWHQLWPAAVNDFTGFPAHKEEVNKILVLARKIGGEGFADMTEEDVHELIASHDEDPSNEELVEMTEEMLSSAPDQDDEDDDDVSEGPSSAITTGFLRTLFQKIDNVCSELMDVDPLLDRAVKFKRGVEDHLAPYKELYRHMQMSARQTTITGFFRPRSATPSSAASTTSSSSVGQLQSPDPVRQPVSPPEEIVDIDVPLPDVADEEDDVDDPLSL